MKFRMRPEIRRFYDFGGDGRFLDMQGVFGMEYALPNFLNQIERDVGNSNPTWSLLVSIEQIAKDRTHHRQGSQ